MWLKRQDGYIIWTCAIYTHQVDYIGWGGNNKQFTFIVNLPQHIYGIMVIILKQKCTNHILT